MFKINDLLPTRGLLLLLPLGCCNSPGPGTVGSFMLKLFIKLERLRSSPVLPLAGDALLGERCKPALIAAAACNDDTEGDLGDGGLGLKASMFVIEILRGLDVCKGEPEAEVGCEGGSELRSGDILPAL